MCGIYETPLLTLWIKTPRTFKLWTQIKNWFSPRILKRIVYFCVGFKKKKKKKEQKKLIRQSLKP